MRKNKNILEVRNVNKTFRNGKYSVFASQDVSFDIPKGKVVGLIGESGSGKTTMGRTILNLLYPDSGSIKINNTEIGERKLSKKQKNDLYRNIQMIFQDPYSSLNTQKNIMKIVSESLNAKGIDKEIFNNFFDNRKKMLFFSKYILQNFLHEQQWNYFLFEKKLKIETLNKITNKIDRFNIDDNKTITKNFINITSEIYNIKEENNYNIISEINNLIKSLYDFWLKEKNKILSENYSSQDEKDLDKIRKKYKSIKKELKESLETQKIKSELKNLNSEYKEIAIEKKYFISTVKKQYKTNIRNIKTKAYSYILDQFESKNIREYENFKKLYIKEKIMIGVIKRLRAKKVYVDFNKVINFLKKDQLNIILKNYEKKPKANLNIKNNINKIVDNLKTKNPLSFDIDISKIKNKINNTKQKLSISIKNDKKRDLLDLKSQYINTKKEKDKHEKIFKNELKKFISEKERKIKVKINKIKKESKSLALKLKNLLRVSRDKEKNIIKEILSLKNYEKETYKNIYEEKKYIKDKYANIIKKDKALNIEIKESNKILRSIKFLYGIIKFNFLPFEKKKLKEILVREEVFKTLEKVGLNRGVAYRYPHEFSGGMRQRVGIARAIISKPKLIIADEPIAALDVSIQAQIVNLLMDLKKSENLSMLFIAHDLSMIEHNSDEVIIMHLGRIVEKGKTEIVFKNPIHPYTKTLMDAIPTISKINEKFQDKKFIPTYLNGYGLEKKPEIHEISKDHYVFGTNRQIKKWK